MSHVTCHMSRGTCHMSRFIFINLYICYISVISLVNQKPTESKLYQESLQYHKPKLPQNVCLKTEKKCIPILLDWEEVMQKWTLNSGKVPGYVANYNICQ